MSDSLDSKPPPQDLRTPEDLPPLQETLFDEKALGSYLSDLSQLATALKLDVKGSARGKFENVSELSELRVLLGTRSIWGAQLRYRVDGAQWLDTLLVKEEGFRLIRIQQ